MGARNSLGHAWGRSDISRVAEKCGNKKMRCGNKRKRNREEVDAVLNAFPSYSRNFHFLSLDVERIEI